VADLSDYLQDKLVKHSLGIASFTMPSTVYVALFTTATTAAGGGTEVTGGSYSRKTVAFTFGSAGSGAASNTSNVDFANMPTCTVTHAALFDASTSGNMLLHGPLAASKSVTAGDTFRFPAGDIDAVFS
jgi:hypothetical protein